MMECSSLNLEYINQNDNILFFIDIIVIIQIIKIFERRREEILFFHRGRSRNYLVHFESCLFEVKNKSVKNLLIKEIKKRKVISKIKENRIQKRKNNIRIGNEIIRSYIIINLIIIISYSMILFDNLNSGF